ncbi:CaiB/BaiF CoA-transferase family protein [Aminobacter sp. NyZ550]|jgi:crotonobetainyl-CoA:carnitine CoA-transferase CaiB-like acyl-CoA transferase|uniref:CoA transferase n=2 Tax=Aminobacter TaxID=31988 RepID=A0AAC8YQB0_AMIAI|nr:MULTISPECIES: CaiB/BaiF CoA-transferase family protein [Aminobacter]AMS41691.1 CoA transferase [Aminobacter aminovorans]MBA8904246.1 crotonobetainyl-CoA:carnitine CoA-transferase CaiB-like acyl-CoA transferase [Aminobacter ciceronei]MBA9018024.1 crotonobetainyl-CoA:carnitine CoA-transferase CaiB-like acyl-CoA transferase [Aminobacter ciceronei]MBB3703960.1 crotonobetainyl-CoA:carnitine CoA-transferase CaiB-like acyl-CoA transferase [Aminobacter aminovorans]MRX35464.1 CoA transferase [Aminob
MSNPPLHGIRVIELARILAGPWAGQLLADLGADVIKVENPDGGDDTRKWGPPFVTSHDGENLSAAYYHSCNRGKRSIALDFSTPEGAEIVRKLVAGADVLIENFKLGGLKKYGLDYDSLKKINPKLVYCSITGFGQDGPYAPRAGYDFIVQGMSGLMSITGPAGGEPQKVGVAVTDIFTGLYSVIAIQAALRHAEATGQGQHVDMALFDAQMSVLANQNLNYLVSGNSPVQMGNAHPNISPYEVLPVRDGHFILAVGNDGQFQKFCAIVGLEAIATDPLFATNSARVANRVALREKIVAALAGFGREELLAKLEAAGVPASPINTIGQAFADPQAIARGMRLDLDDGLGNRLPSVRAPMVMSETPLAYDRPSPRLGQHTAEILAELEKTAK